MRSLRRLIAAVGSICALANPSRAVDAQSTSVTPAASTREGDFRPGDRIYLYVARDSALRDTFTVQANYALVLPNVPSISLRGVTRADLQPYLAAQLRQYIRDTLVRASPLVLVGVLGQVTHPGYYRMPLELTLADALMIAGGPTGQANVKHLSVRHADGTAMPPGAARGAMLQSKTLAELGIDAGDELVVAEQRTRNWTTVVQILSLGTGLLLSLRAFKVF